MLVNVALLLGLGVGDDAARHGTGYLTHQDVLTLRRLNHDVGMLVLLAGLGQPCLMVVAVEVLDKLHPSVHWEPVGMDVQRTHEDGNHQSSVVEVVVLLRFLYDDDLAVSRGNDGAFRVAVEVADGAAIEVERQEPCRSQDGGDDDAGDDGIESIPEQCADSHDKEGAIEQFAGAFVVNSYLL